MSWKLSTPLAALLFSSLFVLGLIPESASAAEELSCLQCHKYRGLSRIDETGKFRLYYINKELFDSGPHSRNKCKDCHQDIDRIPHNPAKKVDCTQACHLLEPSENKKFSHTGTDKVLAKSVHSPYEPDGRLKANPEDYPTCKDCHDQPFYRPLSFDKGVRPGVSQRSISRCKSCHPRGDFAESFYNHVTTRLHKTRTPKDMVRICAKCHADPDFRKRHDLAEVIDSYKDTFHYKLMSLGAVKMPDCMDCHVVYGENVHLIESHKLASSAVSKANLPTTCRTEGCHDKAGAKLASFQTHVSFSKTKYPTQYYMLIFFKALLASTMYFFLTFIFLELLRRLFPRFSFSKKERAAARARAAAVKST